VSLYKPCDDQKAGNHGVAHPRWTRRSMACIFLCCKYRSPVKMLATTPRSAWPCPPADAHSRRHSQTSAPAVARRDVIGGLAVLLTWCGPTALAPPLSLSQEQCRRPRTKGSRAIRCRSQVDRALGVSRFAVQRCHSGAATGASLCRRGGGRAAGTRRQQRGSGPERSGNGDGVRHQRFQLRRPG